MKRRARELPHATVRPSAQAKISDALAMPTTGASPSGSGSSTEASYCRAAPSSPVTRRWMRRARTADALPNTNPHFVAPLGLRVADVQGQEDPADQQRVEDEPHAAVTRYGSRCSVRWSGWASQRTTWPVARVQSTEPLQVADTTPPDRCALKSSSRTVAPPSSAVPWLEITW